jgi:hypothetical protein
MAHSVRHVSARTKIVRRALWVPFAFGVALVLTLLFCFTADLLGIFRDAVGRIFPTTVVLLVYDAGATLLLRLALAFSVRLDRSL